MVTASDRALVAAVIVAGLSTCALGGDPPSAEERETFEFVRARMTEHVPQMPKAVANMLASFAEGCWDVSFPCPPGSRVTSVKFKVCTRLVAWSAEGAEDGVAAGYVWDSSPDKTIEAGVKTICYNNEIMIDSSVMTPNESDPLGRLQNEGLLYHELLHGQIGVDWLVGEESIGVACACGTPNPATHSDEDHAEIHPLEDGFLSNVAALDGDTVQVFRPRIPVDNRDFRIDLGQKNNWTGVVRVPQDGNVEGVEINDSDNNGHIILTGRLIDPAKPGHVIVLVDPPSLILYWFVKLVPPCRADCTEDARLNVFDFLCFQTAFSDGDPYADLNDDGVLNVFDFLLYQTAYSDGC